MLQTGFIFSCSILINYILSYFYQYIFLSIPAIKWNFYTGHFVQLLISALSFLLPAIFFGRAFGFDFKRNLDIRCLLPKAKSGSTRHTGNKSLNLLWAALLGVVAVPIVTQLNNLFVYLIRPVLANPEMSFSDVPASPTGLIYIIIMSALYPAIAEELYFRGVLTEPLRGKMPPYALIIFGAFLFAISHFSLKLLMAPFLMGIIFGYLTWKTRSLIPAMVTHFVYNTLVLVVNYLSVNWILITDTTDGPGILYLILKILSCAGLIVILCYAVNRSDPDRSTQSGDAAGELSFKKYTSKLRLMDFVSFLPGAFLLFMTFLQELSFL